MRFIIARTSISLKHDSPDHQPHKRAMWDASIKRWVMDISTIEELWETFDEEIVVQNSSRGPEIEIYDDWRE